MEWRSSSKSGNRICFIADRRGLWGRLSVFLEVLPAVCGNLREFRPEVRHVGEFGFGALGSQWAQFGYLLAPPLNHDHCAFRSGLDEFRGANVQVTDRGFRHVLPLARNGATCARKPPYRPRSYIRPRWIESDRREPSGCRARAQ